MGFSESLWVSVFHCGFLWFAVCFDASVWVSVICCVISMGHCVHEWFAVYFCGLLLVAVVCCGFWGFIMGFCCSLWVSLLQRLSKCVSGSPVKSVLECFTVFQCFTRYLHASLWLSVVHPVQCEGCHRASFTGFRYKCQNCFKYNLCQDCFWRGRTSGVHNPDHQMKEYTSYVSHVHPV